MVEAMVQLAHGLGMTPLAEGIETAEELAFLQDAGCTLGQGFHFARPLVAGEIPALIAAGVPWRMRRSLDRGGGT